MALTNEEVYSQDDRSYVSEIYNRIIYPNWNSKAKYVGRRYIIRAIYSSGRISNYRGGLTARGDNVIGMELVLNRIDNESNPQHLIRVFYDGYGLFRPYKFYWDLGSRISNQINNMIQSHFHIMRITREETHPTWHLRRRPICTDHNFTSPKLIKPNFGEHLISKYNIQQETQDVI